MAYQITYGPVKRKKEKQSIKNWKIPLIVFLAVLLVSSLGALFREELLSFLLPGDPEVTAAALQTMAQQIGEGQRITDALTCFCQEIVENANFTQ